MNDEPHLDRNALNENIQRTVDRTALRKVRKLADELQAEDAARQRAGKRALIITGVVVTGLAAWLVAGLIASDSKFERGQTVAVPDKVVMPNKD